MSDTLEIPIIRPRMRMSEDGHLRDDSDYDPRSRQPHTYTRADIAAALQALDTDEDE